MDKRRFTVLLLPLEEGGYQAYFPNYPGCFTWGDTVQEAMEKAQDAIVTHLEGLAEQDLDLNLEFSHVSHVVVGEMDVEIPSHLAKKARAEEEYEKNPAR